MPGKQLIDLPSITISHTSLSKGYSSYHWLPIASHLAFFHHQTWRSTCRWAVTKHQITYLFIRAVRTKNINHIRVRWLDSSINVIDTLDIIPQTWRISWIHLKINDTMDSCSRTRMNSPLIVNVYIDCRTGTMKCYKEPGPQNVSSAGQDSSLNKRSSYIVCNL